MAGRLLSLITVGVVGGLLLVTWAASAGESLSLERLVELVHQSEESAVAFTEHRSIQYLTEPIVLEGVLSYSPPDRLTREIHRPKRETMVVEGDLLTLRSNWKDPPVRVLLSDYPGLDALISALRAVLSGDTVALERRFEVSVEGSEAGWSAALTPRLENLRSVVEKVVLRGAGGDIGTIEVLEAGGDRSVVTIHGST